MQDNIFTNTLLIDKDNISKNIDKIITQYKDTIINNQDLIEEANRIDIKNNNGFLLDYDVIKKIFDKIEKEEIRYGMVTTSLKDEDKKIIYGKEILDIGNVVVINDGNSYVILEMILRNILVLNTTILVNNGYMYATNNLLISLLDNVLEIFKAKYLIQMIISDNYEDILTNYANIDLVVGIGSHELQKLVTKKSRNKTLLSGYENFDLYIEDISHIDFLETIINSNLNINIYVNQNLNLDYDNIIVVSDIREAIAMINYNGNRYSASIFTNSKENASKFIKEVKSKIVTINTNPLIERIIDIKESDLGLEKTIIYPMDLNKL